MKLRNLTFIGFILVFLIAKELHSQNTKPNVILIYLDDSGYGDVAHNGNPTIKPPILRS